MTAASGGSQGGPDFSAIVMKIRSWQLLTGSQTPEVEPGSNLADDSTKSPTYDVGHSAWSSFVHAVDHLHAMQALITEAEAAHSFAPFSLIRGGIDNAATAVWLLAPDDQAERLFRRLHLAYQDANESGEAVALLGPKAPQGARTAEVRKQEITDLSKRLGVNRNGAVGARWTGYEKIVLSAASEVPNLDPKLAAYLWRACSGFAHGRQWASLQLLDREERPRSPGVASVRFSSSAEQILLTSGIALRIADHALALYDKRRRAADGAAQQQPPAP